MIPRRGYRSDTVWWSVALSACALWALGCGGSSTPSKPQGTSAVPRVTPPQRTTTPVAEPEPEPAEPPPATQPRWPVGPWLEWQVAENPAVTGKSYLKFVVTPGAETVLELTSYDSATHEESPSLYLRALSSATSLQQLVNQKIPAKLFVHVQLEGTENLLVNLAAQPAEIVVTEIVDQNARGTFTGQLHDITSGGDGPITGRFQAVVEPAQR